MPDANQPPKKFYDEPWLGQPFKLRQNEVDVEYAAVSGVRVTGRYINEAGVEANTWAACLKSPLSHEFRFYHNTHIGDWLPLTTEEIANLRGAAVLGDVVDKATFLALSAKYDALLQEMSKLVELPTLVYAQGASITALEERLDLHKDVLAVRGAAPPPVESAPNGRPARVQTAGTPPAQRA